MSDETPHKLIIAGEQNYSNDDFSRVIDIANLFQGQHREESDRSLTESDLEGELIGMGLQP